MANHDAGPPWRMCIYIFNAHHHRKNSTHLLQRIE
jgi:hypothetical protein